MQRGRLYAESIGDRAQRSSVESTRCSALRSRWLRSVRRSTSVEKPTPQYAGDSGRLDDGSGRTPMCARSPAGQSRLEQSLLLQQDRRRCWSSKQSLMEHALPVYCSPARSCQLHDSVASQGGGESRLDVLLCSWTEVCGESTRERHEGFIDACWHDGKVLRHVNDAPCSLHRCDAIQVERHQHPPGLQPAR